MNGNTVPRASARQILLTTKEAAARARVSPSTVTRAAATGDLHAVRVGPGGRLWRIPEDALERWLGLEDGPAA